MNFQLKASARRLRAAALALLVSCISAHCLLSETPSDALPNAPQPAAPDARDAATIPNMPRNLLKDQAVIWTSPARVRPHDLVWLVPLLGATGVALAADRRAEQDVISHDPSFNNANTNASNVLIGGFIATPVVLYGMGHFREDEHARETGVLGAEALLDGLVVEQGMKLIFWRERPSVDNGRGRFFQSNVGTDSGFPSSHGVLAWSTAAVLASEYTNPWAQIGIYGAATGVSLTRVMGQQHFPSDVLVGGAAGWLVGRYVYRHHHRHPAVNR